MNGERPILQFGRAGHEREYVLNIPGYDINNYIPRSIELALQERLPGWDVSNRGSRIEIFNMTDAGTRDDSVVYPAVFAVVGMFDMLLPTVDVLDGDSGEIVNCAVVRERDGWWDLKPLSAEYFDAREWLPANKAFNMAWWKVGKDDMSAQPSDKLFSTRDLHRLVLEVLFERM